MKHSNFLRLLHEYEDNFIKEKFGELTEDQIKKYKSSENLFFDLSIELDDYFTLEEVHELVDEEFSVLTIYKFIAFMIYTNVDRHYDNFDDFESYIKQDFEDIRDLNDKDIKAIYEFYEQW